MHRRRASKYIQVALKHEFNCSEKDVNRISQVALAEYIDVKGKTFSFFGG
ncbi:hypothetical protein L915_18093 [Phytophthora nicotianae]|uniref:Uncharacterized protein n=1 Tax=Phytophthora nicotianae TaxID=4792 RepID=W2I5J2_PHYNI|nr:hypothetical protein L915_18093 [Phytophthora nicotianae]ETL28707.1 hypothetical protein L916_17997 [Phytophthora nicotianae]